MKKFTNVLATLMLMMAMLVVGCTPEDDPNNGGGNGGGQNVSEETINGVFSVDTARIVYFSSGNLQYKASGNTWCFAEHQWDYLGNNGQDSDAQNVDRDLFGWGTSGYNHGAVCYHPWSTSVESSDYHVYGKPKYDLCDSIRTADWGYNAIINGGNVQNVWRTLTDDEWTYIFTTRYTPSGIRYAKAKVNDVTGLILLPDDWKVDYYTLNSTDTPGASFDSNVISASQWDKLEQHGAVFLPTAGYRNEFGIWKSVGNYWSASHIYAGGAHAIYFSGQYVSMNYFNSRSLGASVRLVRSFR